MALLAAGVALTATATSSLALLAAALLVPGAMLGALFATAYVLADQLAPPGSGTRTFAWLVTANNGGLAVGRSGRRGAVGHLDGLRRAVVRSGVRARGSGPGDRGGGDVRTRTQAGTGHGSSLSTFRQDVLPSIRGSRQRGVS